MRCEFSRPPSQALVHHSWLHSNAHCSLYRRWERWTSAKCRLNTWPTDTMTNRLRKSWSSKAPTWFSKFYTNSMQYSVASAFACASCSAATNGLDGWIWIHHKTGENMKDFQDNEPTQTSMCWQDSNHNCDAFTVIFLFRQQVSVHLSIFSIPTEWWCWWWWRWTWLS